MIRITHVLCPIDFSETSQHALDHASAIATWYGARLTVLFAFVNVPTMDLPPMVLEDADRARLTEQMRAAAAGVPPQVPIDFVVREAGSAQIGILDERVATKADLLVLGTHGRSGFERLFLGSVTEKVIRTATCPTLVVPPRAADVAADAPVRFRRILCPVDFSATSLQALAAALDIAKEASGTLTLLHVVPLPPVLGEESIMLATDLEPLQQAAMAAARRQLTALIPEHARDFCTVQTDVTEGSAHGEILRLAKEQQSDLIVIGVHGRRALDLAVFGSTTHGVIRSSTCPVLVMRTA